MSMRHAHIQRDEDYVRDKCTEHKLLKDLNFSNFLDLLGLLLRSPM